MWDEACEGGLNVKLLSRMTTKPATRDVSLRISIFRSLSFSKGVSVFVYVGLYTHLSFAINGYRDDVAQCCKFPQFLE